MLTRYFLGVGSNVAAEGFAGPLATVRAAVEKLADLVEVTAVSSWYDSAPRPPMPGQGRYANGVAVVRSERPPARLLEMLQKLELKFGRIRPCGKNEPRTLDLDILAAEDENGEAIVCDFPIIPHPRICERPFVLLPLAELEPNWRHPTKGNSLEELIAALPPRLRNLKKLD